MVSDQSEGMPMSCLSMVQLLRQLPCMLEHTFLSESRRHVHDTVWLQKPQYLLVLRMSVLRHKELLCATQVMSTHHDATAGSCRRLVKLLVVKQKSQCSEKLNW